MPVAPPAVNVARAELRALEGAASRGAAPSVSSAPPGGRSHRFTGRIARRPIRYPTAPPAPPSGRKKVDSIAVSRDKKDHITLSDEHNSRGIELADRGWLD